MYRIRFRGDAHRVRPVKDQRAQIARIELVLAYAVLLRGVDLVLAERNLHGEDLRGTEQSVGMIVEPEYRGAIGRLVTAYAFEDAHAVMQRVRAHVRRRVAPRHHFAVVPDPS